MSNPKETPFLCCTVIGEEKNKESNKFQIVSGDDGKYKWNPFEVMDISLEDNQCVLDEENKEAYIIENNGKKVKRNFEKMQKVAKTREAQGRRINRVSKGQSR